MRPYAERRAARIERLQERADAARRDSAARYQRATQMASVIPMGQPVLVGHYSEKRDRNYRAKIDNNFNKAFEANDKANELARRAAAAESNTAISSDDPDAIDLLKAKLAGLEAEQALDKLINKAVRSSKTPPEIALLDLGLHVDLAIELVTPCKWGGGIGVPSYRLSNRNANINRVKDRIAQLERAAAAPAFVPEQWGEARIELNDNRIQIFFPGKPADAVRETLKSWGFRWAPSEGAWQRMAGQAAYRAARAALKQHGYPEPAGVRPPSPQAAPEPEAGEAAAEDALAAADAADAP